MVQKTLPILQIAVPLKRSRLEYTTPSGMPELAARTFDDRNRKIQMEDQCSRYGRVLRPMKKFGK